MTIKTTLTALVLLLAPGYAIAACSGHDTAAMSCADGMVMDPETNTCVEQVTG